MKRALITIILVLAACDAKAPEPVERVVDLSAVSSCEKASEFDAACFPSLACEIQSTIASAEAEEAVAICRADCARAWEVCLYDEEPGSEQCQQCEFTAAACTGLCG